MERKPFYGWNDGAVMHVEPAPDLPNETPGDAQRIVRREHCACCVALEARVESGQAVERRLRALVKEQTAEINRLREELLNAEHPEV